MEKLLFEDQLQRLVDGFSHRDLTSQRSEALWKAYGKLHFKIWQGAMDNCLLGNHYPTAKELEMAVSRAKETSYAPASQVRPYPSTPRPEPEECDSDYGQWRLTIIKQIQAEKLKPWQVAQILGKRLADFPKQRSILESEIEELEGTAHWRDVSLPDSLVRGGL